MACLRASFASIKVFRSSASTLRFVVSSAGFGSLQAGHRLAKPGLSGLSSNSSEQTTQTRTGNAMPISRINEVCCQQKTLTNFESARKAVLERSFLLASEDRD